MADQTRKECDIVLDFNDVAAVTPPFLDELFESVRGILKRNEGSTTVIATNLDDDLIDSIEVVLEKRGFPLAWQDQDRLELLAAAPHLRTTLEAAAEAQEFTATDLAARLRLQPTTVNQRLVALLEAGVVAREREPSERGIKYRYRTPQTSARKIVRSR